MNNLSNEREMAVRFDTLLAARVDQPGILSRILEGFRTVGVKGLLQTTNDFVKVILFVILFSIWLLSILATLISVVVLLPWFLIKGMTISFLLLLAAMIAIIYFGYKFLMFLWRQI
jgi:hypothetical protein